MRLVRRGCTLALLTLLCQHPEAQVASAPSADLPLVGIAGITFRTSDLGKARGYYQGVLGLAEAFTTTDSSGRVASVFFKVNDEQYIEVVPGLAPGTISREVRVMFQSSDLVRLRDVYAARGVNPTSISRGADGNPVFRVIGPDDAQLDFVQYVDGSKQTLARGKFLDPRRISTHLQHVGIYTKNRDSVVPFYQDKLGFARGRDLPGTRGDYVETPSSDRNLETKFPALDPNNPATRSQYDREVMGAVQHIGLEVADMRATRDIVQERGGFTDLQVRAHVGNNRHWLMHLFDPDGSRTEVVETALQDTLPPMTVMAPGRTVAPPILPTTAGEIPWPSAKAPPANQQRPGGQGSGRYVEASALDFNDHAGWLQMFDGTTRNGWDGP